LLRNLKTKQNYLSRLQNAISILLTANNGILFRFFDL
jgi:hypothetical protein